MNLLHFPTVSLALLNGCLTLNIVRKELIFFSYAYNSTGMLENV